MTDFNPMPSRQEINAADVKAASLQMIRRICRAWQVPNEAARLERLDFPAFMDATGFPVWLHMVYVPGSKLGPHGLFRLFKVLAEDHVVHDLWMQAEVACPLEETPIGAVFKWPHFDDFVVIHNAHWVQDAMYPRMQVPGHDFVYTLETLEGLAASRNPHRGLFAS